MVDPSTGLERIDWKYILNTRKILKTSYNQNSSNYIFCNAFTCHADGGQRVFVLEQFNTRKNVGLTFPSKPSTQIGWMWLNPHARIEKRLQWYSQILHKSIYWALSYSVEWVVGTIHWNGKDTNHAITWMSPVSVHETVFLPPILIKLSLNKLYTPKPN